METKPDLLMRIWTGGGTRLKVVGKPCEALDCLPRNCSLPTEPRRKGLGGITSNDGCSNGFQLPPQFHTRSRSLLKAP